MDIEILQQNLSEEICPLCQNNMYEIEANIYGRLYHYFQCTNAVCKHQIFPQQDRICYCQSCRIQHKKELEQSSREEIKKKRTLYKHEKQIIQLEQLSFLHKLFLLSLLENHFKDDLTHSEYIPWYQLKYTLITPNYHFQKQLLQQFLQEKYFEKYQQETQECYYINLALMQDDEPNLYIITMSLRHLFYNNFTQGIPFLTAAEVKQSIYQLMYQQIVQYCQFICQTWRVQIVGNLAFENFCFQLLEHLALSQIFHFVHQALHYLYAQNALQKQNDKFINTNLLKKTLQSYYQTANQEKWELYSIPYPEKMPISHMSYILFYQFLNLSHEELYYQPIWKIWQKIEPRLKFYEQQHYCIHCGSKNISTEYEINHSITLYCQDCQQRNYYFIS